MRLANRMRAVSLMVSACQASSCVRIIQPKPSSQLALVLMARLPFLEATALRFMLPLRRSRPKPNRTLLPNRPGVVSITLKGTRLAMPVNLSVSDPSFEEKEKEASRALRNVGFFFFFFFSFSSM